MQRSTAPRRARVALALALAAAGAASTVAMAPVSSVADAQTGTTLSHTQFTYGGYWSSDAATHWTESSGATATFKLTGTSISIKGPKAPWHGRMGIRVDGGTEVVVDTYASTHQPNVVLRTFTGLSTGEHTIVVRPMLTKQTASTGRVVGLTGATSNGTATTGLPAGVPQTLRWSDEFNDTTVDPAKWNVTDGWAVNAVTTRAANVSESGGSLRLRKATAGDGAHLYSWDEVDGKGTRLQVGEYAEARVWFSGGATHPNWDAWWTSGPDWPAGGEHDIAEVLDGRMTTNYHYEDASGNHVAANQGIIPGTWGGAFHTYGVHRKASSADVYYDGQLVKSYPTSDPDVGHSLIFTVGAGNVVGSASEMKVDWVRVYR